MLFSLLSLAALVVATPTLTSFEPTAAPSPASSFIVEASAPVTPVAAGTQVPLVVTDKPVLRLW